MFEEYNPSRRSRAPISPDLVQASADRKIFTLYSAENRRRVAFATTSTSLDISFEPIMTFNELIPLSFLALYTKLPGGECLIYVGTEGFRRPRYEMTSEPFKLGSWATV